MSIESLFSAIKEVMIKNIKNQFPLFAKHPGLIYLDNAATTHKPQVVIDAMVDYYTDYNANIHRGIYSSGEEATVQYEGARATVAQFLNAETDEIVFVKNATEGINLVAFSWGLEHIGAGDQIILTEYEHHANILPWQRLAQTVGATLAYIPVLPDGTLDYQAFESMINSKTKLIACTAVSNVTGAYTDIKKIVDAAHKVGARLLLDATQLVAHERVDVKRLDVDFLVFSAHKLYGPTGIGALYIKRPLADQMVPYQLGGAMVFDVDWHHAQYAKAPYKFEAGTQPIAQAIGLSAAIRWIESQGIDAIAHHEHALMQLLLDGLMTMPHIRIIGPIEQLQTKGHLVSFVVKGMHAHDVAAHLNDAQIAVRAGHHCAQPLAKKLGIDASVRVSVGCYNTVEDIQVLLTKLRSLYL